MKEFQNLIDSLEGKAMTIQDQDRSLTTREIEELKSIYQALPAIRKSFDLFGAATESPDYFTTYKIVSDVDGKLKKGVKTACNFWNRFISPHSPIVIRLGVFTSNSSVIARAYKPYENDGTRYGAVEFNTKYLDRFDEVGISGTIVHEIGHTLGFGWDKWTQLYNRRTGKFKQRFIEKLPELADMRVELEYGPGTRFSHWDEERFDGELMTGIKDTAEYVLPVTVDVLELLDHKVIERLDQRTGLADLLFDASSVQFFRQDEADQMDVDYYQETEIWEELPYKS